jgi:hypothetical protein
MRRIHLLWLGLLLLILLPAEAQAAEPRQGDTVVVGPTKPSTMTYMRSAARSPSRVSSTAT